MSGREETQNLTINRLRAEIEVLEKSRDELLKIVMKKSFLNISKRVIQKAQDLKVKCTCCGSIGCENDPCIKCINCSFHLSKKFKRQGARK